MNAQLTMSYQLTFLDTLNAISSRGLADGASRSGSQDGLTTGLSGRVLARANHSAPPASKWAERIRVIYGLRSAASSTSAALQLSLESKLQALTDVNGSPEYALTWKRWDMLSGPPICALRASARRTSVSGCFGWPTPDTNQRGGAQHPDKRKAGGHSVTLQDAAILAGWPTPQVHQGPNNSTNRGKDHGGKRARTTPQNVPDLVGWVTPTTRDHKDTIGMATTGINPDGSTRSRLDQLGRQVGLVSGWATPTVADACRGAAPPRPHDTGVPLNQMISGLTPPPSAAPTARTAGFQLNPRFSLWLMGFPTSWHDVGVSALRSLREPETP
jgi:hypothetical protein